MEIRCVFAINFASPFTVPPKSHGTTKYVEAVGLH